MTQGTALHEGDITASSVWKELESHHQATAPLHMRDLFHEDANRFDRYAMRFKDFLIDFSIDL